MATEREHAEGKGHTDEALVKPIEVSEKKILQMKSEPKKTDVEKTATQQRDQELAATELRSGLCRDRRNPQLRNRYLARRTPDLESMDRSRAYLWLATFSLLFGVLGFFFGMLPGHAAAFLVIPQHELSRHGVVTITELLFSQSVLLIPFLIISMLIKWTTGELVSNKVLSSTIAIPLGGAIGGVLYYLSGGFDTDVGGAIGGAIGGLGGIILVHDSKALSELGPLPPLAYLLSLKRVRRVYLGQEVHSSLAPRFFIAPINRSKFLWLFVLVNALTWGVFFYNVMGRGFPYWEVRDYFVLTCTLLVIGFVVHWLILYKCITDEDSRSAIATGVDLPAKVAMGGWLLLGIPMFDLLFGFWFWLLPAGVFAGALQRPILHKYADAASWWAVATAVGFIGGVILGAGFVSAIYGFYFWEEAKTSFIFGLIFGAVLGIVQALCLCFFRKK